MQYKNAAATLRKIASAKRRRLSLSAALAAVRILGLTQFNEGTRV
jgi:hypothetical protein